MGQIIKEAPPPQRDTACPRTFPGTLHIGTYLCNENMQHYPYLWPNRRNFRVLKEIVVVKHDGDVRARAKVEIWPFRAYTMHPALQE